MHREAAVVRRAPHTVRRPLPSAHPRRQLADVLGIPNQLVVELERKKMFFNDNLRDMSVGELSALLSAENISTRNFL